MTDELTDRLRAMPTAMLVAILREREANEWRPEVFPQIEAILRERGVDTAALQAAGPPLGEAVDVGALETVASFRTQLEANLYRMALEEAGIDVWLSTENLAGIAPQLGLAIGVDVRVRPENAAAARDIQADVESGTRQLPDERETCPHCGSTETEHSRRASRLSAIAGWAIAATPMPSVTWQWKCSHCGHQWE